MATDHDSLDPELLDKLSTRLRIGRLYVVAVYLLELNIDDVDGRLDTTDTCIACVNLWVKREAPTLARFKEIIENAVRNDLIEAPVMSVLSASGKY